MDKTMTPMQRELARHALGLPNKKRRTYRNHFCIGVGGTNYEEWQDLVANGLAVARSSSACGGDDFFHLTLAGARMVLNPNEHISREDAKLMRQVVPTYQK
jgi:hypothetical protein